MSNLSINQIRRNSTKDNIIKGIKNLFRSERKSNSKVDKIIRHT